MIQEILAHVILLGFAAYVISSANPGSSTFSWHPTCMVLAWVIFTEGVLLFRKPRPSIRVGLHWALQASGMGLIIIGFIAIFRSKGEMGKEHFTSYHGICGLVTIVFLTVQSAGGNLANYSVPLSRQLSIVKPKLIKWGHRVSGGYALTGLTLTIFLALFTSWFTAVTQSVLWWVFASLVAYPLIYTLKATYF